MYEDSPKILAVRIIIIVIDKMWETLYFCIVTT